MANPIFDYINLHTGEEKKSKVLEYVTANTSFRGANLWILACAIIIASVGLNVNSTAVIIGAMLISPLMGPILGAGFALGTYDFPLLKKSLKNLFIATLVGLIASTIYFFISPFKEVQSELLSRTSPNIYDVLIAFFGGLVGVIAITRVERGNPIPGVAIATALMPPLCTAGFGLATGNFTYFIGAFYLYTINCFFICIATFFGVKYLNYPATSAINQKYEKRIRNGITALILIMIIPSFYLAYNLYEEKKFSESVEDFISSEFSNKGFMIIYKKVSYNKQPRKIDIAFLNHKFTNEEIESYNEMLPKNGMPNTVLSVKQEEGDIKSEILNELNIHENVVSEKDVTINNLKRELGVYRISTPNLMSEMQILFPELENISMGRVERYSGTDSVKLKTVLLYNATKNPDETKLKTWLEQRLTDKNVEVIRDQTIKKK